MAVVNMMVGATTPDGASFVAKVDGGGPVRVAVALDAAMTSPVFTDSATVDAQGVAKVPITGLAASTRHWWQVEDNSVLDTSRTGQLLTHPPLGLPATFTIGVSGDAGLSPHFPGVAGGELDPNVVSNHPVYDTIRQRALPEGWLLFANLGDWGYPDWGTNLTDTLANRRTFFDDLLAQPRQAALWEVLASTYNWDDHDFAANNSDGTYVNKANAATVYRERIASYDLPDPTATYWSQPIGRVLFIGADVRYNRSPNSDPDGPSKTMLGSAQKAWMDSLLATSTAKLLVWLMPGQWKGTDTDTWASFATEQAEMVQMFGDHGFLGRMCIIGADAHMVALDTGGSSPGNIPVLQAAAIDASPTGDPSIYDLGGQAAREQYGTLTVQDLGTHLAVTLAGWQGSGQLVSHTFTATGDPPAPLATGALLRSLPGSHRPVFEARVLTSFQTGTDPQGETIPILDGNVHLDGTAKVQRDLSLLTEGANRWPRRAGDLLAPLGNEVWVRRGVDFGEEIRWFPLGFFRIDTPRQADASDGPIRLTGGDRMAGIVEGRLVEPRELAANRTIRSVFDELVHEIYPAATVLFDDGFGTETLGRPLIVERDRYQFLRDLADSGGKIFFWDDEGFARVEFAPDPGEPVWQVRAGELGVTVELSRQVTRIGVPNAVVATGIGRDNVEAVRAVAVDANPQSPTFFGGRFGRVPLFLDIASLTAPEQAATAASRKLRRLIGLTYTLDFQSVVNPALRPYQPVEVTYRNGDRELHVLETLDVPLRAGAVMRGSTKEQTLVKVQV